VRFIQFELRLLWQNKLFKWLIAAYLLAAFLAIIWGQMGLQREYQQRAISEANYQAELADYKKDAPLAPYDSGYMSYYQFHPVWQKPSAWSALINGERSEAATHTRVRLLGLQSQLSNTATGNIAAMPIGKLDLSFIWIYLMPLLIAALSLNLLAEEKASGRWSLLASQVANSGLLLTKKMLIAAGLLAMVNVLILLAAVVLTDIRLDGLWWQIAAILLAYQLCWFVITGWIISLQRSAIFNSLLFISLWIVFAFVLPGLAYLYQTQQQQPAEHVSMVFDQREYMHDSWDRDKQADFDVYLQDYPQWQTTESILQKPFDWRWYYAMQHMSDVIVADAVNQFRDSRIHSHRFGENFAWLSPVMRVQYSMNRLADTDMLASQSFLDQVADYQQQLRDYFFQFYFFDKPFTAADFTKIPVFDYRPIVPNNALITLINLVIVGLFFIGLILLQTRRNRG
jgi:ABC-2 type transport system permease protein|tara:strand:+ start:453 stop:1817 length:1365 start_codon:yes stop_codon:yes gene_type:complete